MVEMTGTALADAVAMVSLQTREALGVDSWLGSIEAGGKADLIAVDDEKMWSLPRSAARLCLTAGEAVQDELASTRELLGRARGQSNAIPAFNIHNMKTIQAVCRGGDRAGVSHPGRQPVHSAKHGSLNFCWPWPGLLCRYIPSLLLCT